MNCSKWLSNEKILDVFVRVLSVNVIDDKNIILKDYERFVKSNNISIEKYLEIKQIVIEKISKKLKINELEFKYFLDILNEIKLRNATLNASNTQLNFILLFDLIIPFLVSKLDYDILKVIQEYINDIPFKKFLEKYPHIKKTLQENKNYEAVNKNIHNWIKGKNISNNSKDEILEIIESKEEFEIVVMLQNSLNMLKDYFNQNLEETQAKKAINTILGHIKLLIDFDFAMRGEKDLYQAILYKTSVKDSSLLREYYRRYIQRNDFLFDLKNLSNIEQAIEDINRYNHIFVNFEEDKFFNLLDEFFLVTFINLNLEVSINELKQEVNKYLKNYVINNDLVLLQEINELKKDEFNSEFISLYEKVEDKTHPFFTYFYAEYLFKQNDLKNALEYYKKTLNGINCIGIYVVNAIKKGLMISAKLNNKNLKLDLNNNKAIFTKFYFEAVRLGIEEYKNLTHALNDYKLEFERYFGELKTFKANDINHYIFNMDDYDEKIKPDFKNPNKKIKVPYKNYKIPQLIHFAGEGSFEDVKRLVENGADVNYLGEIDNSNALLSAVENPLNEEKRKIALYLIDKMDLNVMEKVLPKKKESALSYAIRFGEVEIVEKLLEKGFDISFDKRVGEGNSTYLNYTISVMIGLRFGFGFKILYGDNNLEKTKKIFDLLFENTDKESLKNHKKDQIFMEQLKDFYPEKWEEFNEIS